VHSLELKSQVDWIKYCASGKKPHDITRVANKVYAKSGWESWGDWLGTGKIARHRSFENARASVRGP
jgi:hypothetical protein